MTLNPYELNGTHFLLFYAVTLALVSALVWPRRPPASGQPRVSPERLRLEHWAILAGGLPRAAQAVFARALQDGIILWNENELRYEPKSPESTDPLSGLFASRPRPAFALKQLENSLTSYESDLQKWGLLQTRDAASFQPTVISLGYGFVLLLGLVRIFQGLINHRPIGFLVLLMIPAGILWYKAIQRCQRKTREGLQLLQDYAVKYDHIRRAPPESEQPLAVALGGIAALNGSAYGHVIWALEPEKKRLESSDGGWIASDSSGSAGSGDAGDGGGSGCGGSGCGGCGGD
ncbi:MAG TPA: TIGR04222 domain-containing membrane protein [Oligoflexus sp.]|uniref:TIGR04222 domain-containing membrane protein n=1 Tax=Oligoflexus sp. TaxID=1971216 RepID=UPI002D80C0DA|nr:TIGR04222 domain-containing membrane protein [Oligoflexus sp.]HET9237665.1 TIGR04222 domain-containing membrane protein [Oligoflexus sp.]